MRILAIRGANLTSLEKAFAIELAAEPLAHAGLFAITGPTGSGKTTLLDALCLALFDKTPRLNGKSEVRIAQAESEDSLSATDPRAVLRHGAVEGFAEVEFEGVDRKVYRARWSVRRARDQVSGRLQAQDLSLFDMEAQAPIGGKKTEVLQAIELRLGLSFDQFRRSVLLAQGEFAAFLEASAADRAGLLERVTGTQLYREISRGAHERSSRERAQLALLEAGLAQIPRLDAETRAALEKKRPELLLERTSLLESLNGAQSAVRWHELAAKLALEVEGAKEASASSLEAKRASAEREREWKAVVAAQKERAIAEAAEARSSERSGAEKARSEAENALASVRATLGKARTERDALAKVFDEARARGSAREPELRDAERLDRELDEGLRALAERGEAHRGNEGLASQAHAEATRLEAERSENQQRFDSAKTWLDAHAGLKPLAEQWERWEAELARFAETAKQAGKLGAERLGLSKEVERSQSELAQARLRLAEAKQVESAAVAQKREAEASLARIPEPALREEREALVQRERVLQAQQALLEADRLAGEKLAQALGQVEVGKREVAAQRAAIESFERSRLEVSAALVEARRALAQAQAAQDLAGHRAALLEGEACPLCGALEHPYAVQAPLNALVHGAAQRIDALEARRAEAEEQRTRALAAEASARTAMQAAERIAAESSGPGSGIDPVETERKKTALETARLHLAERESALDGARTEAERARTALDTALAVLEQARNAERESERRALEAVQKLERVGAEEKRLVAERDQARDRLAPVLGDSGAHALEADPQRYAKDCAAEAFAWKERSRALDASQAEVHALLPRLESARATATLRAESAKVSGLALEALEAEQGQRALARSRLLEGRPLAEVRSELELALAQAQTAHAEALERVSKAEVQEAGASAGLAHAGQALIERSAAENLARGALERVLLALGMSADVLRERLARDESWIAEVQAELEALQAGVNRSATLLEAAQKQQAGHALAERPARTLDEARAEVGVLTQRREDVQLELARVQAELERDDRSARAQAAQAPALEAQRGKCALWASMGGLVGSADGTKLQKFAQSLTLEALLAHANEQLQQLAPRYALMRVPSTDLELQVIDRDLGDEVRGVRSLSGGEGFLVSLALALGLSQLSSQTTRVESLFIDEGFGTLDPETLEVALAALDSLQASGRQVGLISHVSGLAERIGAQVKVVRQGAGRSVVQVVGADEIALPPPPRNELVLLGEPAPKPKRKRKRAQPEEG